MSDNQVPPALAAALAAMGVSGPAAEAAIADQRRAAMEEGAPPPPPATETSRGAWTENLFFRA